MCIKAVTVVIMDIQRDSYIKVNMHGYCVERSYRVALSMEVLAG